MSEPTEDQIAKAVELLRSFSERNDHLVTWSEETREAYRVVADWLDIECVFHKVGRNTSAPIIPTEGFLKIDRIS